MSPPKCSDAASPARVGRRPAPAPPHVTRACHWPPGVHWHTASAVLLAPPLQSASTYLPAAPVCCAARHRLGQNQDGRCRSRRSARRRAHHLDLQCARYRARPWQDAPNRTHSSLRRPPASVHRRPASCSSQRRLRARARHKDRADRPWRVQPPLQSSPRNHTTATALHGGTPCEPSALEASPKLYCQATVNIADAMLPVTAAPVSVATVRGNVTPGGYRQQPFCVRVGAPRRRESCET